MTEHLKIISENDPKQSGTPGKNRENLFKETNIKDEGRYVGKNENVKSGQENQ